MINSGNGVLVTAHNQIDYDEIISEFRERLSHLGNLKDFRSQHENRSWLGRWWHKGDLEQAQLDAQVLQADFAESLAKLMAINLHLSGQLGQQQNTIGAQQERLAEQNESLREQTEVLDRQQAELKVQGEDLAKLVEDFFELRGLTQNEARKLILIANEVKSTRDDIYDRFEKCVADLRSEQSALKLFIEKLSSNALLEMKEELAAALNDFGRRHDELADRFFHHARALEEHHRAIEVRLNGQDNLVASVDLHLKHTIQEQGSSFQVRVAEVHALALAVECEVNTRFRHAMRHVWWSLGVGISALILGLGVLISVLY